MNQRKSRLYVVASAIAAVLLAAPSGAAADTFGTAGTITTFNYNAPASSYRGTWIAKATVAGADYYTGGTFCTGTTALNATEIQMLQAAYLGGVTVTPRYVLNGNKRCLVAW